MDEVVARYLDCGHTVVKKGVTGAALGTFRVGATPAGVAFDGASIWVKNAGSDGITKLRP